MLTNSRQGDPTWLAGWGYFYEEGLPHRAPWAERMGLKVLPRVACAVLATCQLTSHN